MPRSKRLRLSFLSILATVLAGFQAEAACTGPNLFDALPAAERARLEAAADVPHAQGLLFRARRGAQSVTLVGTYHLSDPRLSAIVAQVAPALRDATTLLVEFGPQEEAELRAAQARDRSLMFLPPGQTVSERLPAADWDRLRAALNARGVPEALGAQMKPAYLAMTLAVPVCAMPDMAQGEGGLDSLLMAQAHKDGIAVAALEPWDTVFRIFDSLTAEDEASLLKAALSGVGTDEAATAVTTADLYARRLPRLIWEFSSYQARQDGMSEAEVARETRLTQDLLVDRRNRAWLPVIEARASAGPVVVAVGALHLSGRGGVLDLLERDGFTVTRLDGP